MHQLFDPSSLQICNDPIPAHRSVKEGKYKAIFDKLKVGQAIKVPSANAQTVATALRKEVNGKYAVKSMHNYGDGMGRVWLLEWPKKQLKAVG